uniref:DUF3421 domain-containing protein n=1 Tax=Anopheles minimus TaxID=112268 RepID=A0A182WQL8_9DIPT
MVNYATTSGRQERFPRFYDDHDDDRYPRLSRKQQVYRWDTLNGMKWVTYQAKGNIPPSAVVCGTTKRGKLYVGRAEHAGSVTPGFIDPAKNVCFIPWGGKEHAKHACEILCTPGEFVPCVDTNILLQATPAGVSEQGEPLYIGRVNLNGEWVSGKVQRSHNVCYIPLKKEEKFNINFEVFIKSRN